jgi:hypothetical protein
MLLRLQGKHLSKNVSSPVKPIRGEVEGGMLLGSVSRRRPVSSAIVPVQAWHHQQRIGSERETCAPNTSTSITHARQSVNALDPQSKTLQLSKSSVEGLLHGNFVQRNYLAQC